MKNSNTANLIRLAIFLSHPIQYKTPLLKALSSQPNIKLHVFYYSDRGLVSKKNSYHGSIPAWDVPLLDGYASEFLPNLVDDEKWIFPIFQPFINPAVINRLGKDYFDAVILHSYQYPSDWLAYLTIKFLKRKVLFYGEMYPRGRLTIKQRIGRFLLNRPMVCGADACLAIGSVAKDVFSNEYQIHDERIFLAPYTVDNDYFINNINKYIPFKKQFKQELGIPEYLPVVLCVAAMVYKKHQQDLVRAMTKIRNPARLILVGHGPLMGDMENFCKMYLPDTIMTGFINQSDLPRYYAIADIFILPSLWDEFGLVVNEAMCAGLPVIASNTVAATRDLIYEGENGFTFPPGDIDLLASKIDILLSDSELRHKFGQRSREIITDWNLDRTVAGIMKAINYVVIH